MAAHPHGGAEAPRSAAPVESGDAHALAGDVGVRGLRTRNGVDCAVRSAAEQAALVLEGADYAAAYLRRLRDGASLPGDLATLVEFLDGGPVLDGFCRVIEKALEARRESVWAR